MSEQTLLPNRAGDRERLLARGREERDAAIRERDEARQVARQLWRALESDEGWPVDEPLWDRYPWLRETE